MLLKEEEDEEERTPPTVVGWRRATNPKMRLVAVGSACSAGSVHCLSSGSTPQYETDDVLKCLRKNLLRALSVSVMPCADT